MMKIKKKIISLALAFILVFTGLPLKFINIYSIPYAYAEEGAPVVDIGYDDFADTTNLQLNGDSLIENNAIRFESVGGTGESVFTTDKVALGSNRSFSTSFSFKNISPSTPLTETKGGLTFTLQPVGNTAAATNFQDESINPSLSIAFTTDYREAYASRLMKQPLYAPLASLTDLPLASGSVILCDLSAVPYVNGDYSNALGQQEIDLYYLEDEASEYYHAWIGYDGEKQLLHIMCLGPSGDYTYGTYDVNLTDIMPSNEVYAGFMGSLGNAGNTIEIKSWHFKNNTSIIDQVLAEADEAWLNDQMAWAEEEPVYGDFYLQSMGQYGSEISWTTNPPDMVNEDGKISAPSIEEGDRTMTLTATIKNGSAELVTRAFTVILKVDNWVIVEADYDWLTDSKILKDNDALNNIVSELDLPDDGLNGSTIVWSSTDSVVNVENGAVTRPDYFVGDKDVTLTAYIDMNGAMREKSFNIKVKSLGASNAEIADADWAWLTDSRILNGNSALDKVTKDLSLPTSGQYGSTIEWESSNESVVDATGIVVRPTLAEGNQTVTLTATLTMGEAVEEKVFTVTVKVRDADTVSADDAWLTETIVLIDNLSLNHIVTNLYMPASGYNGSTISWTTSNPETVALNGKVTRRSDGINQQVLLTATISQGEATPVIKQFVVTVRAIGRSDAEMAYADSLLLTDTQIKGSFNSSLNMVMYNLDLPEVGMSHGSEIEWESSDETVVTTNGTVTRPTFTQGDKTITLTAYISKGVANPVVKSFTVIVVKKEKTPEEQHAEDLEKVNADAAFLVDAGILLHNSAYDNITSNVILPVMGPYGSNISWFSSSPRVDYDGKVTRPSFTVGDDTVTLTAIIQKGYVSATKTFTLIIKALDQSDSEKVYADYYWLSDTVILNGNSEMNHVTGDLNLPLTGINGSEINWTSTNTDIIAIDGKVTRPSFTQGDKQIMLTATIRNGAAVPLTRTFTIVVKALAKTQEENDAEIVNADYSWLSNAVVLNGNSALNNVKENLIFPTEGQTGSEITWTSTNTAVIDTNGRVIRPTYTQGDKTVTLTAVISKGSSAREKIFQITVKANYMTDQELVSMDYEWLTEVLILNGNSALDHVTGNLNLPVQGENRYGYIRSHITWTSNHHGRVTIGGDVYRPMFHLGDQTVTLTATIKHGSASLKKTFTVIVKCLDLTDNESVNVAANWLKWYDILGENPSAGAVTQNLNWPTSGPYDTTITWRSDRPHIISHDGVVNRPMNRSGNQRVFVTATVTKGGEQVILRFDYIVLEEPDRTAPAVTGTTPGHNVTGVLWDTNKITITYNENIVLKSSAGIELVSSKTVPIDTKAEGNKLVITPFTSLSAGENSLLIPGGAIADAAGNPSQDYELKFSVEERPVKNIEVISSIPYDTQKDVDVNLSEISFRFDSAEIVKGSNFDFQIWLRPDKGTLDTATGMIIAKPISQTHTLSGDTVTMKLKEKLAPATVYNLIIFGGVVEDRFLNKSSERVIQFRTKGVAAPEPPEVESVYPADGETDVSVTPNIEVVFSDVPKLKSYPFKLTDALGKEYPLYAPYQLDLFETRLIFKPRVALEPNTVYTLSGPYKSAANPFSAEFSIQFTTGSNMGPRMTRSSPATGEWNASTRGIIEIYFDQPVIKGVNFNEIKVEAYLGMPVAFATEVTGSKAVLRTESELDFFFPYTVYIPGGAFENTAGFANDQNKIVFSATTEKLPTNLGLEHLDVPDTGFVGKTLKISVDTIEMTSWVDYVRALGYGPISYEWYIDGKLTSTKGLFHHTFTGPGEHEIKLTAKDRYGFTYSVQKSLLIHDLQNIRMSLKDSDKIMKINTSASGTQPSLDFMVRLEQEGYFIYGETIDVKLYKEGVLQRLTQYGEGGIPITSEYGDSSYTYTYTPAYGDNGTYEMVFTYNGLSGQQVIRKPFIVSSAKPAVTEVFRFRLYEKQRAAYYEDLNYIYVTINGERLKANKEIYTYNGDTFPVYALRKTLQTNVYYNIQVENWWWGESNRPFYLGKDTDIPAILTGSRGSTGNGLKIKSVSVNPDDSQLKTNNGLYFEGLSTKMVFNVEGDWAGSDKGYYEIATLKYGEGISRYDDPAFKSILVQAHDLNSPVQRITVRPGIQIKDRMEQYWVRMVSAQGYKSAWELCPDLAVVPVPSVLGKELNISVEDGEYAVSWPTVFDGPVGSTIGFLDDIPILDGGNFGLGGSMPTFEGSLTDGDIELTFEAEGGYGEKNKASKKTKYKKVKKVKIVGYEFEMELEGGIRLTHNWETNEWEIFYLYIIIDAYGEKSWDKGYEMLGVGFTAGESISADVRGILQIENGDYSGIIGIKPGAALHVNGDFKVARVVGRLGASIPAEIHFPTGYIGAGISVDASIKAYALLWDKTLYEKNLYKVHWDNGKEKVTLSSIKGPEERAFAIADTGVQLMSRDYLAMPSPWLGGNTSAIALQSPEQFMGFSLLGAEAESGSQTTDLMENIYPQSETALVINGDQKWLVWTDDNPSRDAVNRTQLRLSVFQDGVWHSPEWIYDDRTADFSPSIAPMENGMLLAWHNINAALSEEEGLDEMLKCSEISVTEGIYTADGGKPNIIQLTDDDQLDHSPRLAADNGKALLVWTKSENLGFDLGTGEMTSTDPVDQLYFSSWSSGGWTTPDAITMDAATVLDSSLVMNGEEALLLYTLDLDNDLTTGEDREVFARVHDGNVWGEAIQLTSNGVNDSSPKAVNVDGKWFITWLTDGKISYKDGLEGETRSEAYLENIQSDYRIVAGEGERPLAALAYTQPGEGLELGMYASFYDFNNGKWSDKTGLGTGNKYTNAFSASFESDGKLNVAFTQADILTEAKPRIIDGIEQLVEESSISNKVNLKLLTYTPVHDVALFDEDGMFLSTEFPLPGTMTTVYVTVRNEGDFAENAVIDLYEGNPASGGEKVAQSSPQLIQARSSGEVEIAWLVGSEDKNEYDLYAVVRPYDGVQEISTSNNTLNLKVSASDIAITNATCENPAADQYLIHVTVSNRGSRVLDGAVISLEEEVSGNVLDAMPLKTLELGEEAVLTYMVSSAGQKNIRVKAALPESVYEDNTDNNVRPVSLEPASFVLKSLNIVPGDEQVDVASTLRLDFDMPVEQGSGFDGIRLMDEEFNNISINKTIENSTLTIAPQNELAYGTGYRLKIPADALGDDYGHALKRAVDLSFTTMTTHPEIVTAYPGDGMVDTALDTTIKLRFNQNVTPGNEFSKIGLYRHADGINAEAVPVSASISGEFLTISFNGTLHENSNYTLEIPREAVENERGETPQEDFLLAFKTVSAEAGNDETGDDQEDSGDNELKASIIIGGVERTIDVQTEAGRAVIKVGALANEIFAGSQHLSIDVPSVPGANSYRLEMPAEALVSAGEASLTLNTALGSVRIPKGMLSTMKELEGKTAGIIIEVADKSKLPEEAKAAIGSRPVLRLTLTLDGVTTGWSNPAAPVGVSIPYKPGSSELESPESIVIWYIDDNGNIIPIPNGSYRQSGIVSFETTHFSDYAVAYNRVNFTDVAQYAWYNKAVSFIAAREITAGAGGKKFAPEANLTRGQFITLMMRAFGISPDENPTDNFEDSGNTYYTGFLAAAKRLGITAGVGNNRYAPGKEITRQEMFTLLYNALKVIGKLPKGDTGKTLFNFSDAGQINTWAREAMTLFVETGTIVGNGGNLRPDGMTTRAQMAQILYNLLADNNLE